MGEPNVISYSAAICACEKGQQWEQALSLLHEVRRSQVKLDVLSFSAGMGAWEKGQRWEQALCLLREILQSRMHPNVISYSDAISAGRGQVSALLMEMHRRLVEADEVIRAATLSE